jgi:DNA (cytosine-5)-methyltransferase 1
MKLLTPSKKNLLVSYKNARLTNFSRRAALNLNANWNKGGNTKGGSVPVIDMFSGCGGMSAGFASVNGLMPAFKIAGAIDIDEVANESYERNIRVRPHRISVADLARKPDLLKETIASVLGDNPKDFVLIGCAPCQGFSSHRHEQGNNDPRNSLFLDFAKIAAATRPIAVVVENVPELLTTRYWPLVVEARKTLEAVGYFVNLTVHNMAEFGVPQERFRTLMLAMKHPFESPRGFLTRNQFRTVRQAIGGLPPISPGQHHPSDPMHYTACHKASTIATISAVPRNGGSRPESIGPKCLQRAKERNGRAVYEDVYGRLFWDKPAITITAHARNPASGRYVHPEQNRGLSIREAALLQSFPPNYDFAGSLDERFRQIGNAVPPAFAAFLAAHVLSQLQVNDRCKAFDTGINQPIGESFSRLIPSLKSGHRTINGMHND